MWLKVPCPGSPSWQEVELRIELWLSDSKANVFTTTTCYLPCSLGIESHTQPLNNGKTQNQFEWSLFTGEGD